VIAAIWPGRVDHAARQDDGAQRRVAPPSKTASISIAVRRPSRFTPFDDE
jgi:hypothetical protein